MAQIKRAVVKLLLHFKCSANTLTSGVNSQYIIIHFFIIWNLKIDAIPIYIGKYWLKEKRFRKKQTVLFSYKMCFLDMDDLLKSTVDIEIYKTLQYTAK